jgi:hypothetical protein
MSAHLTLADQFESRWELDVFAGSSLVDMYPKCGSVEVPWKVVIKMPSPDVVSLDLGNAGKCRRHWTYVDKSNLMVCSKILLLL